MTYNRCAAASLPLENWISGDIMLRPYQIDVMFHESDQVFFFGKLKKNVKLNMYT